METAFYLVRVNVLKFGKNGAHSDEDFEYKFDDRSKTLLELRKDAVEKAVFLTAFFEKEMPKEKAFSSFTEAEKNGFEDFNAYSLEIVFAHDDVEDTIFGGDPDEAFDWLESEAHYYMKSYKDIEVTEVERYDGELLTILNYDVDFFTDIDDEDE